VKPLSIDACIERYGRIQGHYEGGLLWPKALDWIVSLFVPSEIVMTNGFSKKPVYRIYCNKDTHSPLSSAFNAVIAAGLAGEMKTFDGCFNVRWVRGHPGQFSYHSWGVAFDFNAKDNPLGGKSTWTPEFVKCFTDNGFEWGGAWKSRPDPMHFQLKMVP
jgi:hypothetical protein